VKHVSLLLMQHELPGLQALAPEPPTQAVVASGVELLKA